MIDFHVDTSLSPVLQVMALILGTFASEDLTCISAGLLIGSHQLNPILGVFGCLVGIFAGDLGLWLIGFLTHRGLSWLPRAPRLVSEPSRRWFERHGSLALVGARFFPGARLPLYVASGLLGVSLRRFAFWTFLAALVWTPSLVILTAVLGKPATLLLGSSWPAVLLAALVLFFVMRAGLLACTPVGRGKLIARVSRLWRWEFWPSWLFYLPVLPWLGYLAVRYRGVLTWTAANPGIPQGGVVGESKHAILMHLPPDRIVPSYLLPPAELLTRLRQVRRLLKEEGLPENSNCEWRGDLAPLSPALQEDRSLNDVRGGGEGLGVRGDSSRTHVASSSPPHPQPLSPRPARPGMFESHGGRGERGAGELPLQRFAIFEGAEHAGWTFPLILKPDAGQRGAGVKRVHDLVEVESYLQKNPAAVLVQAYHPGPFEAGIFYYRMPGEKTGHIFSVTDKAFPVLAGDGRSTLEELIWRHPRYRMQARTFLARHATSRDRVLARGERFALALAGNHCQGTMFRDGSQLITPELECCVDAIAQHFPGFFIGRFDVRYSDVLSFRAGRDFAIVELNGVTSESTNLYDPSWSLLAAYRTLFRQWSLLFRIGHANRRRGHAATGLRELLQLVVAYYRGLRVDPLAD